MEQNSQSLFGIELDQQALNSLSETAKWSKFLAIVWFIGCGLTLAGFIVIMVVAGSDFDSTESQIAMLQSLTGFIFMVILVALEVVPNIFRLKFANKMLKAIQLRDQQLLNESLGNLRNFNRYWGIVTIVIVAIYLLSFAFLIMGLLMSI